MDTGFNLIDTSNEFNILPTILQFLDDAHIFWKVIVNANKDDAHVILQ